MIGTLLIFQGILWLSGMIFARFVNHIVSKLLLGVWVIASVMLFVMAVALEYWFLVWLGPILFFYVFYSIGKNLNGKRGSYE